MAKHELTPETAEFGRACGLLQSTEVVVDQFGQDEPAVFPMERPFLLLGRSRNCDLQLTHADVSFRHAYLQMVGGRLLCVDLASRTGVHWRSGPQPLGWLEPGEEIGVGPFSVCHTRGENSGEDRPSNELSPRDAAGPQAARIEFLNGHDLAHAERSWPLHREVTLVGSSAICKLQLRHETVSKVHSSLVLTPRGLWIVDLLGRGGTRVNGEAVRFAQLGDGDELQLGRFRMTVRVGPEDAPVAGRSSRQQIARVQPPKNGSRSLSRHRTPPADSSGRAFSEQFVLSLVSQFATMQQQMFAQSQQQMMLLTQVFGSMQQNQQDLIREDLLRVQEITRELQQTQAELLSERALRPLNASDSSDVVPLPRRGGIDAPEPVEADSAESSSTHPAESVPPAAPDPVRNGHQPEGGNEKSAGAGETATAAAQAGAENGAESEPWFGIADSDEPEPDAATGDGEPTTKRGYQDVDTHAWLADRIRALEEEREGRWQKMMRVLVGAKN